MQDESPQRSTGRWPAAHIAVLASLSLLYVACGALASVASSDTNRDVFFAQQIASGAFFPLTGPAINSSFHLGPLWYYLLAPAALIPNAAAITAWMGAIAASQFPLAYALGRRLRNPTEGLLFAVCLALPGWANTSFASLTHPSLVIPGLLFAALAALAYRERPDAFRAFVFGVACLLLCTAHPTTVLPAALLMAWAGARAPGFDRGVAHAALAAGVVGLGLLPMVYEQWISDFADLRSTAAYTQSDWSTPSPLEGLRLVHAVAMYGPRFVSRFWLELSATHTWLLFSVYVLVLIVAFAGLLAARGRAGRMARVLAGALLLHSMFLASIRQTMPPWMILVDVTLICALLALGLGRFWHLPAWRRGVGALLAILLCWSAAVHVKLMAGSTEFVVLAPSPGKHGFMDVRDYEERFLRGHIARLPFRQLYDLGEALCEPVTLYGHIGFLVDYTHSISAAQVCGSTANVRFGGLPDAGRTAWMGLHRDAWRVVGFSPQRWIGELGISPPVQVVHSRVALAPVLPVMANFPRDLPRETVRFTLQAEAPADAALLLGHRANRYGGFEVIGARAGGSAVEPRYSDPTTVIFRAPEGSSGTLHWEIELQAHPDYVDLLTFRSSEAS